MSMRGIAVTAVAGCAVVLAAGALTGAAGNAQAATTSTVQVWLVPNVAGATTFASGVTTPGGAQFHHYLSPNAYTARFGASAAHAKAVTAWLTSKGLKQVRVSSGRDYVSATGPVTKLPVPAPLAPDVLGVTGLTGSPDADQAAARTAAGSRELAATAPTCSQYWAQHTQTFHPPYQGLTKGSLPICGYSASQLRAAYGATSANTGTGQTVALTEGATPAAMFQTLTDYAKRNHLPAPKSAQFREVQSGSTCGASPGSAAAGRAAAGRAAAGRAAAGRADLVSAGSRGAAQDPPVDDEAQMDSEAVYAMAPGATQLMVIANGCDEDQSLLDAALSVLTGHGARPSASIESNSWQIPLGGVPPQIVHAIDLRAVAEGVGVYFASGDTPGLTATDADPDATAVGGTTLGLGARGNRIFETGWSDDYGSLDNGKWSDQGISSGSGGDASLVYRQPAYQKGVVPASMSRATVGKKTVTDRAVPDLAAVGDLDTGMLSGYIQTGTDAKPGPYQTMPNAGTSLATPLIAGLVADAQQGQKSAFGFINPLLYRLAGTAAFHDVLPVTSATPQQDRDAYLPGSGGGGPAVDVFDSQEHSQTQQVTAKGYDTMTGVGTPNGAAFISGLRHATG